MAAEDAGGSGVLAILVNTEMIILKGAVKAAASAGSVTGKVVNKALLSPFRLIQFCMKLHKQHIISTSDFKSFTQFMKACDGDYIIANLPTRDPEQLDKLMDSMTEVGITYCLLPDLDIQDSCQQIAIRGKDVAKWQALYESNVTNQLDLGGPLDFEEFLWGMGISEDMIGNLCGYLESKTVIPEAIHSQMMNYYRQYIAIGGMPEAVQKYVDTKDFREVDKIQRSLLLGYRYDIAHYATAEEKVKAEKCYLSLAKQLLDKENHKFQYKEVEHGGRAQKYFSSIEWLLRADMVHLSKLVTDVRFDLDDYARDDFFRAYTTDLSLLMAMKDFSLKQHIVENTLEGNSKGGIYEYAITDALYKKGYQLYFYKNETTKREIDVVIQKDGMVVPIEVKGGNTRANSLKSLMKNHKDISYGYKFADGNIGVGEDGIITLPLYMIAFI